MIWISLAESTRPSAFFRSNSHLSTWLDRVSSTSSQCLSIHCDTDSDTPGSGNRARKLVKLGNQPSFACDSQNALASLSADRKTTLCFLSAAHAFAAKREKASGNSDFLSPDAF